MTRFWVAVLFAAAVYAGADSTAAFDPQEKISLDLKDAKLTEVIATLGAMANLPVVITPGLEATVNLHLKETTFERALESLSMMYGVSIRVENGRLVASAHETGPIATPAVPEQFRDLPRLPVAAYHEAFKDRASVTIRTRWKNAERCYNFDIGDESQQAVVSVSYDADAPKLTLTPFAFDPVSGSRYFAAEAGEARWGLLVSPGHPTSVEDSGANGLRLSLALEPGDCPAAEARRTQFSGGQQLFFLQVTEAGTDEMVMGTGFQISSGLNGGSSHSSLQEEGQERNLFMHLFVFPDKRHVVATFIASAVWRDPRDGRDYVYSQAGSQSVSPLSIGEAGNLSVLPAGVATPHALELKFLSDEARAAAEARAAGAAAPAATPVPH
ncbi:MAG TPA: hypothetical protein VJA66_11455 [Thermoanaerobaculia bacterium]